MPTCPQCHHKWQSVRKVKAPKAGMGSDPGPARWVGCQGEAHEGDWGTGVRTACAADASFGRHLDGCPCTWCASRRALGWRRNAVPDGQASSPLSSGRHSMGWDYPGMHQRQALCPVTDWKAFRAAQQTYRVRARTAMGGPGWVPPAEEAPCTR